MHKSWMMYGLVSLVMFGCGPQKQVQTDTVREVFAVCNMKKGNIAQICVDYGFENAEGDCNSEVQNYSKLGSSEHTFLTRTSAQPQISCSLKNSNAILGSCFLNGKNLRYYGNPGPWTADLAEKDCVKIRFGHWDH